MYKFILLLYMLLMCSCSYITYIEPKSVSIKPILLKQNISSYEYRELLINIADNIDGVMLTATWEYKTRW